MGLRSEKEIKERINLMCSKVDGITLAEQNKEIVKSVKKIMKEVVKELEWTLEGESRYSVAELEKIDNHIHSLEQPQSIEEAITSGYLIETLKDKKKVEEILNG